MSSILLTIWNDFTNGIIEYALNSFANMNPYFYPLIFFGIIGYIYAAMQSITVAIGAILITFGLFATTSSIFVEVDIFSMFMYIITVIGITCLVVALFIKYTRS